MTQYLEWAGNILLILMAAAFWAFTALYTLTARWERSEIGRGLFLFSLICAGLLTMGIVRLSASDLVWVLALRVGMYAAILYVVVRMTLIMLRTQKTARRAKRN